MTRPWFGTIAATALAAGCGTTRWSDTSRTATEQLLVSHAVDQVVSEIDFSVLSGKTVFFDAQFLDGTPDRGYVVGSIRQRLLGQGCLLQEDRTKADYIVEARSGGTGTDRHDQLLLGVPQVNLPTLAAGIPTTLPEIPLIKKTHQIGAAKLAVYAYRRTTGEALWQSGIVQRSSTAKNYWVFGAGPVESGSVRKRTQIVGEFPLALGGDDSPNEYSEGDLAVARPAVFLNTSAGSVRQADATVVGPASAPAASTPQSGAAPAASTPQPGAAPPASTPQPTVTHGAVTAQSPPAMAAAPGSPAAPTPAGPPQAPTPPATPAPTGAFPQTPGAATAPAPAPKPEPNEPQKK
jgi:hypothetical protein